MCETSRSSMDYASSMGDHSQVLEELFNCNRKLIKAAELRQSVKVICGIFYSRRPRDSRTKRFQGSKVTTMHDLVIRM